MRLHDVWALYNEIIFEQNSRILPTQNSIHWKYQWICANLYFMGKFVVDGILISVEVITIKFLIFW